MSKKPRRIYLRKWHHLLISAILAIIFSIAIFTACNPIWHYAGVDSACFALMGRGILAGKVPYVDLIDNKGPVLYLLNAFAQVPFLSFSGAVSTIGIWFMELIFLFLSLRVIAWICNRLGFRWQIIMQIIYLLLILPLIETGNIGEEYSNFFTLLAFTVVIKYKDDDKGQHNWQYGLSLGILFMLNFLIRPNNALPIAALILIFSIGLCVKKRFDIFFLSAGMFLLGIGIILGPILGYLIINGAFNEWLNQTIFVNLQYSGDSGSSFRSLLFSNYGLVAALMFILTLLNILVRWICSKNEWKRRLVLLGIIFSSIFAFYSAFISGFTFNHYLMIGTVPFIISIIEVGSVLENNRESSYIQVLKNIHWLKSLKSVCRNICLLLACVFVIWLSVDQLYRISGNLKSSFQAIKEFTLGEGYKRSEMLTLAEKIPKEERNSVYILETGSTNSSNYYVQMGLLPSFKAFVCVDRFCRLMPGLEEEYYSFFKNLPPKWLMSDIPLETIGDIKLKNILQGNYQVIETNNYNVSLYSYQPKTYEKR